MSKQFLFSKHSIIFSLFLFACSFGFLPGVAGASTTYNFNSDTVGQTPANMTVTAGTLQVANHGTLGQSLEATAKSTEIAGAMFDSFASSTDMSVTWQEAYTDNSGHDGFILRAQASSTTLTGHTGARLGYLFQLYGSNTLYIWKVTSAGFTQLWTGTLAKASPRYYRASTVGTQLTFEYSDDGTSFTTIGTATDSTYTSGQVQYTAGYGINVGIDYVDNVIITNSGLDLSGSTSAAGTTNVSMAISDLRILGPSASTTPVKLLVTNGSLAMSTVTGLTFTGGQTGSTLYFSGTVANINNALATLIYTRASAGTDTLEVSLVNAGEVFFSENNHLYKFITSTTTWNSANSAAPSQTAYGVNGYLATITSQTENDFVAARLVGDGWFGASDSASEGTWKWVTGPESGTTFWSGASGGSTVGGNYANWASGEPNDSGGNEDCAQFYISTGKWNDLPCSGSTLSGYVAEFGTTGSLPVVVAKNVAITTTGAPTLSTLSPADNATNITTTSNLVITLSKSVTVGTGNIVIKKTSDDSIVETIAVTSGQVTGSGTTIITINPTTVLDESTEYYIIVPATAFKDVGDNFYAGLLTSTVWNFTTGDFTAPTILSITSSKADGSYKADETIITTVTFSENVTSTGVVTLTFETGTVDQTCTFSITNSSSESCTYTVQNGDNSDDLSVTVSGTITDQASNALVDFAPLTTLEQARAIVIDTTAPVLTPVTTIANTISATTAGYTFSSSETGTYTIEPCGSGAQTNINVGQSVSLSNLNRGNTYTCGFNVTDSAGNISNTLIIGPFTVVSRSGIPVALLQPQKIMPNINTVTTNQSVVTQNTTTQISSTRKNNIGTKPFLINMKIGSKIDDVRRLQEFLKLQGPAIYPEGLVTGYFGPLTHKAVVRFQEKNTSEILDPIVSKSGTGFVGEYTRSKINQMITQ
jgi:hypothetical protein